MSKLKTLSSVLAFLCLSGAAAYGLTGDASPVYGVTLPEGYRRWEVITVAHEAGKNNDIRAVLGNDVALKAFREGTRPFPDGAIIARLAYVKRQGLSGAAVVRRRATYQRTNQREGFEKVSRNRRLGLWPV
jgi:hypothetical protein